MELVCIDYLSLEMSKGGFENVLVISDHYTKYAVAVPTRNQSAIVTADVLFNQYIVHYGFPRRLHSDQGAQFEGNIIKELCKLSGMLKSRTTPYNPACNGVTERFNRTLLSMLGTLNPDLKQDWKSQICHLVHAYNCCKHDSTGFSPYMLMFGRQPRLALDVVLGIISDDPVRQDYGQYVSKLQDSLRKAYELATKHTDVAQQRQKANHDLKARAAILEVGDRILVKILAVKGKCKIADKWEECPYLVLEQPNVEIPVYRVQREDRAGQVRTLHRKHLLPFGSLPVISRVDGGPQQPSDSDNDPIPELDDTNNVVEIAVDAESINDDDSDCEVVVVVETSIPKIDSYRNTLLNLY